MSLHTRVLSIVAAIGLASCSGGGGSSSPIAFKTAAPVSTSGPTSPTSPNTSARFTITVPNANAKSANKRSRQYISTATQSVVITLVSVNGTAYSGTPSSIAANLTTSNPNCTGSPLTCAISAPAVAGADVFTVVTYDATQTSTNPSTPAGNLLSRATTSVNVTAGIANTVTTPLVLSGVVSSVTTTLSPSSVTEGTPSTVAVIVNALDADGNIIMGAYSDANGDPLTIDLTDSNTSGSTMLAPTSTSNSSTSVSLSYNGNRIHGATISTSVTGGTIPGNAASAALTIDAPPAPTLTGLSQNAWADGSAASSFTETLTGTNFTPVNTDVSVDGTGVTVASVTVNSATSITATIDVAAEVTVGNYNVTVATPGGTTSSLPIEIASGFIVTSNGDTTPGTPPGTGAGAQGDLRYAINEIASGGVIVFQCGTAPAVGCDISLAGPLPIIEQSMTIDGGGSANTTIDGASLYRAFFVDTGTVAIEDMTIQHVLAAGGAGNYGGGGGLGAGAGVFVNQSGADVTVANVVFSNVSAIGGAGSDSTTNFDGFGGGGGGGLGAPGGANPGGAGSGGGGVLTQGGSASNENAYAGGGGGGGLGGAEGGEKAGGAYGASYGSNAHGTNGANATLDSNNDTDGGNGGMGGFGGGGGGGGEGLRLMGTTSAGNGGPGGFGGGGGAGGICAGCETPSGSGGKGGPGGGGGGGAGAGEGPMTSMAGSGGALASVSGGNGSGINGGGGAAAGPAIFVANGTLTTTADSVSAYSAMGGTGSSDTGGGSSAAGSGTAGAAAVFNYAGTVNGSTATGDVTSAIVAAGAIVPPSRAVRARGR